MSLHIYTDKSNVPKDLIIVHDNDSFFEVNTSLYEEWDECSKSQFRRLNLKTRMRIN